MFQNTAMMALGYFVFMRKTVPFQRNDRKMSWDFPENKVIGVLPKTQFTGKASETITLSGTLMPEITGGTLSLALLEVMAESGEAFPLISGATFMVEGWFVITEISQTKSELFGDGTPRKIEFSLSLKRVDDSLMKDIADAVESFL